MIVACCSVAAIALPAAAEARYTRLGIFAPLEADLRTGRNTIENAPGVVFDPQTQLPKVLYDGREYWNPVTVSQYGLQEYNLFVTNGSAKRWAGARRAADWLVRQQAADGAWDYRMPFSFPRDYVPFAVPWIAAQAQGNAISLLVRVWRRSGDARYEAPTRRALLPLRRPVGSRGVRRIVQGREFYEGFPTVLPSLCLEDFQLALLGLYDAAAYSPRATRLFGRGLGALSWALPHYTDGHGRPLHDLMHLSAPLEARYEPGSHALNARVLTTLAAVTRRTRLATYAARWTASRP